MVSLWAAVPCKVTQGKPAERVCPNLSLDRGSIPLPSTSPPYISPCSLRVIIVLEVREMKAITPEQSANMVKEGKIKSFLMAYREFAIEVSFPNKPSSDILSTLKGKGFRWNNRKSWELKVTPAASPILSSKEEWERAVGEARRILNEVKDWLLEFLPKPLVFIDEHGIYLVE